MPWNYETTAYMGGKPIKISELEIINLEGTGGMTRSGHVFSPKFATKPDPPVTTLPKEKSILVASPYEEGEPTCIHHKRVTSVAPPKMNDVMNKPAKSTPLNGKGVLDVEVHLKPHKENISPDES